MNTQIKTNQFPSFLNDFVNLGLEKIINPIGFKDDFGFPNVFHQSPVNIIETEENFQIEMIAAGREKSDFVISLDKNLLTISYSKKEDVKEETAKIIRKEFTLQNFKRTFTLSEQVDASKIVANYTNGILYVVAPKKVITKVEPTTIAIQ